MKSMNSSRSFAFVSYKCNTCNATFKHTLFNREGKMTEEIVNSTEQDCPICESNDTKIVRYKIHNKEKKI